MVKMRVKLVIRYPDGTVKVRIIESNDVKVQWKKQYLWGVGQGDILCARKTMIHDSAQGWSNTETGSLKAGTGDGTCSNFVKVTTHTNPSPVVTYSIDKVHLYDATYGEMAVAVIAPPEAFPPGAEMTVEYEGEFIDKSDASHPAVATIYILYEMARAFGQDSDSEALACGLFHNGTIKLYYDQPGGTPQAPIEKTCKLISVVDPTDTTNGMNVFKATGFYHATHNAAVPTKVVLIPTDADEAHAYADQTASLGGPFDLTSGTGITITYKTEVTEGP